MNIRMLSSTGLWPILLAVVILALMQFILPPYLKHLLTIIMIFSIYAMAFDLLYGYTGLLSFGHSIFFGVGAYGFVMPIFYFGFGLWPALIIALLASAIIGLIIGFFAVRVGGAYFVIITLIFSVIFYYICFNQYHLTGGETGLTISIPPISLGIAEFSLYDPSVHYYFVLMLFIFSYILLRRIVNSPMGRIFRAIRENEERTRFVGYNVDRYKLISFVLSGTFSGLSGALFALSYRNANALAFMLMRSADPVLWTLVGGVGTLVGPITGTAILIIITDYLSTYVENYLIIVGVLLIVVIILAPKGIIGSIRQKIGIRGGGLPWPLKKQFLKQKT